MCECDEPSSWRPVGGAARRWSAGCSAAWTQTSSSGGCWWTLRTQKISEGTMRLNQRKDEHKRSFKYLTATHLLTDDLKREINYFIYNSSGYMQKLWSLISFKTFLKTLSIQFKTLLLLQVLKILIIIIEYRFTKWKSYI